MTMTEINEFRICRDLINDPNLQPPDIAMECVRLMQIAGTIQFRKLESAELVQELQKLNPDQIRQLANAVSENASSFVKRFEAWQDSEAQDIMDDENVFLDRHESAEILDDRVLLHAQIHALELLKSLHEGSKDITATIEEVSCKLDPIDCELRKPYCLRRLSKVTELPLLNNLRRMFGITPNAESTLWLLGDTLDQEAVLAAQERRIRELIQWHLDLRFLEMKVVNQEDDFIELRCISEPSIRTELRRLSPDAWKGKTKFHAMEARVAGFGLVQVEELALPKPVSWTKPDERVGGDATVNRARPSEKPLDSSHLSLAASGSGNLDEGATEIPWKEGLREKWTTVDYYHEAKQNQLNLRVSTTFPMRFEYEVVYNNDNKTRKGVISTQLDGNDQHSAVVSIPDMTTEQYANEFTLNLTPVHCAEHSFAAVSQKQFYVEANNPGEGSIEFEIQYHFGPESDRHFKFMIATALKPMPDAGDLPTFQGMTITSLIELLAPDVHRRVKAKIPGDDADDVVANVFVAIMKEASRERKPTDPIRNLQGFFGRVTNNKIVDHIRWNKRQPKVEPIDPGEIVDDARPPESSVEFTEHREIIEKSLTAKEFKVLCLRYFDGLSHKEIGEAIEATHDAVKMMLWRIRKKLRPVLEDEFFPNNRGNCDEAG